MRRGVPATTRGSRRCYLRPRAAAEGRATAAVTAAAQPRSSASTLSWLRLARPLLPPTPPLPLPPPPARRPAAARARPAAAAVAAVSYHSALSRRARDAIDLLLRSPPPQRVSFDQVSALLEVFDDDDGEEGCSSSSSCSSPSAALEELFSAARQSRDGGGAGGDSSPLPAAGSAPSPQRPSGP